MTELEQFVCSDCGREYFVHRFRLPSPRDGEPRKHAPLLLPCGAQHGEMNPRWEDVTFWRQDGRDWERIELEDVPLTCGELGAQHKRLEQARRQLAYWHQEEARILARLAALTEGGE